MLFFEGIQGNSSFVCGDTFIGVGSFPFTSILFLAYMVCVDVCVITGIPLYYNNILNIFFSEMCLFYLRFSNILV